MNELRRISDRYKISFDSSNTSCITWILNIQFGCIATEVEIMSIHTYSNIRIYDEPPKAQTYHNNFSLIPNLLRTHSDCTRNGVDISTAILIWSIAPPYTDLFMVWYHFGVCTVQLFNDRNYVGIRSKTTYMQS